MIKLLCLLFSVSLLNGQNIVYLYPDHKSVFESWLQSQIKKSPSPISILTPSMDYRPLHKSLITHQAHGGKMTLIVTSLKPDPIRMIQYQHTDLLHYQARPLLGSLIIIDPYVCQFSAPLEEELLNTTSGIILCSDDPQTLERSKELFGLIQKRSRTYLK